LLYCHNVNKWWTTALGFWIIFVILVFNWLGIRCTCWDFGTIDKGWFHSGWKAESVSFPHPFFFYWTQRIENVLVYVDNGDNFVALILSYKHNTTDLLILCCLVSFLLLCWAFHSHSIHCYIPCNEVRVQRWTHN
jgi:succinate dehydrogenase/fumarate reductase cytochrome b subunit